MSDEKCCCTEATDEYMDFLTNNYMSFDDMYWNMVKPKMKENNYNNTQEEQAEYYDEDQYLRPMYDYQNETSNTDAIDFDDLIERCKNGDYNPFRRPIGENTNFCGGNCRKCSEKQCKKSCEQPNHDRDGFYVPNRVNEEEDNMDTDIDYMKNMYPQAAKKVLRLVEDECDKLEYAGSCMFDEYPDRTNLSRIVIRIYEQSKDIGEEGNDNSSEVEVNQLCSGRYCPYNRCVDCYEDGRPNWLYQMIQTMLYQEMLNRRRRYRYRRWR